MMAVAFQYRLQSQELKAAAAETGTQAAAVTAAEKEGTTTISGSFFLIPLAGTYNSILYLRINGCYFFGRLIQIITFLAGIDYLRINP